MEELNDTILVVDDNPNNLKVVAGVLKDKGYNFRVAKSGKLALSILEKTTPDLILLDIQMPEMDGFETCKRIKAIETNSKIPIIYLTANTDSESIKKAFNSGGVDYVTKPFNADELLARIKTHIKLKNQTEELTIQNVTKDKFFSIISHDLINPLSGVIGFSELLIEDLKEEEYSNLEKYTNVIYKSGKFTLDLLQNLLEWSRIQVGSIKSIKHNFNISNLLKNNIDGISAKSSAKEITIIANFSETLPVFADEKMVSTVIRNLLTNALKFTPNKGEIIITSEEKIINNKQVVETIIKDTGIGISEENRLKLFKIETNYKSLGTNNEKGTGLGLILCKEFLDQNNGTIKVESEEGVGSSFIFTLDAAK